jgi:hypothetical protein
VIHAQAFGVNLVLHDDLALAALSPPSVTGRTPPTILRRDPDAIRERWSGAQAQRTRELRGDGLILSVDHDPDRGYLLQAPGTGVALISGDGIDVRCAPGPRTTDWRALLAGQILPLVATVRGLEVFHAAGVVWGSRAYLLCGAQGVGKTSLAAHLVMAGAQLLSDDVMALDDSLGAHPGVAVLHIRDRELQQIALGPLPGLTRLATVRGRTRLTAKHPASAQQLGAMYLLERAPAGEPIEPVPSPSPISLLGATFNLSVQTHARVTRHLDLCARVAASVPIFKVRIVPGRGAAKLAQALSAHIDEWGVARV